MYQSIRCFGRASPSAVSGGRVFFSARRVADAAQIVALESMATMTMTTSQGGREGGGERREGHRVSLRALAIL
eukprot:5066607-Pyramimonas_sp.AAC.2